MEFSEHLRRMGIHAVTISSSRFESRNLDIRFSSNEKSIVLLHNIVISDTLSMDAVTRTL